MSQPGAAQEEDPQPEHLFSKQLFRVQVSAEAWPLLQTCCLEYQESGRSKVRSPMALLVFYWTDTPGNCFVSRVASSRGDKG